MRRWAIHIVCATVITAACSSGGPDEQLQKASSWAATAHMLAQARLAGSTPEQYSTKTLDVAGKQLQTVSKSLQSAKTLPDAERSRAVGTVDDTRAAVMRLDSAIARHDEAAITREAALLDSSAHALSATADTIKASARP